MSKKAVKALTTAQPIAPLTYTEESGFYNLPNGTATNLITEILISGGDVGTLPTRKRKVAHGGTIQVNQSGKRAAVRYETPKAELILELTDLEKLTGSNKPAKKLLAYALIKANQQIIHSGELGRDYVSFPLRELVDIGNYSSLPAARQGFKAGLDALTSLKVKGTIRPSKKKERTISALEVLFTGGSIKNNQCTIYLNPRIDWGFIVEYFTILPTYYFRLPNRASDLLLYIFYLARQNTREIAERGYFTIGFRAIQARLGLPDEKGLNNPQRDIKDCIDEALEKIEEQHKGAYNNMEFSLLPVYPGGDAGAPIAEYLDKGYLEVHLSGAFASTFIEISKDTAKQIESHQKRQQRITEKALAINAAKHLESESSSTDQGEPPPQ
jgi:hypothetical protein